MASDGKGLCLRIRDTGGATWTLRCRFAGRDTWMPLGDAYDMTLSQARKEARANRVLLDRGIDPLTQRRKLDADAKSQGPSRELADRWFHSELDGRVKHPLVVRRVLDNHILPTLGKKKAQEVSASDCETVLSALRDDSPTVANDVLRYLKRIFAYAKRRHLITCSPVSDFGPTRDAGGKESARNRALSGEELVTLFKAMGDAPALGGDNALAIKLMLALCVRKGELLAARWSEFDLEGRTVKGCAWRLPAERTKTATAIEIPLAPQVVSWLKALHTIAAGKERIP